MNVSNIKKEIFEYILEKETTGALLLTGKWGSGKTFLIKEIANDLNQKGTAAMVYGA